MSSQKIKILLAEDEEIISTVYELGLTQMGYSVVVARDGLEAIKELERDIPHILLLDIIMPNMNGFEVLKAVRGNSRTKKLPIMVMSNLSQSTDEAEARKLGANDYLIKANHSLAEIVDRMNVVLNN